MIALTVNGKQYNVDVPPDGTVKLTRIVRDDPLDVGLLLLFSPRRGGRPD